MWALAHHLLLGVAVAALAAAALRVAAPAAPGGLATALAAAPLFAAAAVISALVLGLVGLGASPLALTAGAVASWLAARHWVAAPEVSPWADLARWWRGLPPAGRLAIGALGGLVVVYGAWLTRYPYVGVDGLGYHLPDVVAWIDDGRPGSRNHVLPLIPVESYPVTNEVLLTWFIGISRGFAVIAPYQLAWMIMLGASLRLGLRELGLGPGAAWAAVAAMVTVPILVGELNGPLTDLPAVAWLACTGALCATAVRRPALLAPALVAAALAVGTKTTTLPAAVIALTLSGLAVHRAGGRLPRAALAAAALVAVGAGGVWYLRNLVVHGSPMWPLVSAPWGDAKPPFLRQFDVRFIEVPERTLSRHWHSYRVELAGSLALMAGALAAPLLVPRRRVLVAAAAGIGLVAVWTAAPYTGIAPRPVFEELAVSTIRYLMPAVLACCVAVAVAAGARSPGRAHRPGPAGGRGGVERGRGPARRLPVRAVGRHAAGGRRRGRGAHRRHDRGGAAGPPSAGRPWRSRP